MIIIELVLHTLADETVTSIELRTTKDRVFAEGKVLLPNDSERESVEKNKPESIKKENNMNRVSSVLLVS